MPKLPREFMKDAVEIGKKSIEEPGRSDPTPRVGAVIERDGEELGSAFRGATGPGAYAEFGAIERVGAHRGYGDLTGATLYTTLEPCTIRGPGKTPCANHIVKAGIKHVVIGLIDPNRDIQGDGVWLLQEKGVIVSFFESDLIREIQVDNLKFIGHHRPLIWLPPSTARSLDDWYFIINAIYLNRNQQRSPTWLFSHLVEVIGALSMLVTDKNKPDITLERFMPKCFAWWFALCNAAGLRSVESLVWNKYPAVCSYCHGRPHDNKRCAIAKAKNRNPDWGELHRLSSANTTRRPRTLEDWKLMFYDVYPPSQGESYDVTFGRLCEELGELSECVRTLEMVPTSFLSEAADVFAWLMHLVNLYEAKRSGEIDLSSLLFEQYPDRCRDCNSAVCSCPPLPRRTLKRLAHDGPPGELVASEHTFLSAAERMERFDIGTQAVEFNGKRLQVTPALIEEVFNLRNHFGGITRRGTLKDDIAARVERWLQEMAALAASQRVSQAVVNKLVLFIREIDQLSRDSLSAVFNCAPPGQLRDSLLLLLKNHRS